MSARIYVTEPGHTGGVGAIGMRVLVQSLRDKALATYWRTMRRVSLPVASPSEAA